MADEREGDEAVGVALLVDDIGHEGVYLAVDERISLEDIRMGAVGIGSDTLRQDMAEGRKEVIVPLLGTVAEEAERSVGCRRRRRRIERFLHPIELARGSIVAEEPRMRLPAPELDDPAARRLARPEEVGRLPLPPHLVGHGREAVVVGSRCIALAEELRLGAVGREEGEQ